MRTQIDPEANRERRQPCTFCGQPLQVTDFTPDRYGGHWSVKPCECEGTQTARRVSEEFRRKMAGH